MQVADAMTKDVQTCRLTDPVANAATLMEKFDVGSIPIVDDDLIVHGIITDRDIVIRGVTTMKDLLTTPCRELMSKDLVFCQPDTDIHEAADLMAEHQVRRLPVIDNQKKLVGICALGDLAVKNTLTEEAAEALSDISRPLH